jgi:hypothetical protein
MRETHKRDLTVDRRNAYVVSKAIVAAIVSAVLLSLLTACSDDSKTPSNYGLSTAYVFFKEGYVLPVSDALAKADSLCGHVDPATQNPSCGQLVAVLEERNPNLKTSIELFRALELDYVEEPGKFPLSETIDFLDRLYALNKTAIDAWRRQDRDAWLVSWGERDHLAEEMDVFFERADVTDEPGGTPPGSTARPGSGAASPPQEELVLRPPHAPA